MNMRTRIIALTLGGWIALGSSAHAQTQSTTSGRATVAWTIGVSGGDKFDSCGGRKSDSRQHGLAAG
jgi:hypothetical protein